MKKITIKIIKYKLIGGKQDYTCNCPICNLKFTGYDTKLLFKSIRFHLIDSHKFEKEDVVLGDLE